MVCVECGSEQDHFNFLCENCYLKSHPLISSKNKIKISLCKNCMTPVGISGTWEKQFPIEQKFEQLSNVIESFVKKNFKLAKGVSSINVSLKNYSVINEIHDSLPNIVEVNLQISASPDPFLPIINFNDSFNVFIRYKICIHCQNVGQPATINGKLQIRGIDKWKTEINNTIQNFIDKCNKEKKIDFIPIKIDEIKEGLDLSFSTKNPVEILAMEFHKKFGTQNIKTDETITYDHMKSKSIKRIVISVRLPPYKPGDVIKGPNYLLQVISISGVKSKGFDYLKNSFVEIESEILWDPTFFLFLPFEKMKDFQITNLEERTKIINLMDLETFQEYELDLPSILEVDDKNVILGFLYDDEEKLYERVYFNFFNSNN